MRAPSVLSILRAVAGLALCLGVHDHAQAQAAFPARPITMVIPFAAGGPVDTVAKIVGQKMSHQLGQQVIFEYVAGSGGTTAATRVKRAPADGYTILVGHMGTHGAASVLYKSLAYDPVADFSPLGLVETTKIVVVTRLDLGASTPEALVALSRDASKPLTMAHAGVGSVSYVACQMFNGLLGLDPRVIAFQGTGPAMVALDQGKVDYLCDQMVSVIPHVREGRARAFVVASDKRSPLLPDVPTSLELKMDKFIMDSWIGLFAPRDTPAPVLERLDAALNAALDDPDTRKQLDSVGGEVVPGGRRGAEALRETVKFEVKKWASILKPQ